MKRRVLIVCSSIATLAVCVGVSGFRSKLAAQTPAKTPTVNWPLHNLDLAGTRYSPLDQINRSNVKTLTPRWLFQHGVIDGVSNQTTPIIVDGTMYVTDSRGSVYALDAADGHLLWTYDVTSLLGGGAREGYIFRNRGAVLRQRRRLHGRRVVPFCARRQDRERRFKASARTVRRA